MMSADDIDNMLVFYLHFFFWLFFGIGCAMAYRAWCREQGL